MDDLDSFRRLLRINKNRLDDELELQADVMDRLSERIAKLIAEADGLENELKLTEARLFRQFKDDDEKLTDKAAESAVKRHQERARALERYSAASYDLRLWQGLYEAWKAKGYAINKLCDLYAAQYFTKDSHSISSRSDRRRGEEAALRDRKPYEGGLHSPAARRRINEG